MGSEVSSSALLGSTMHVQPSTSSEQFSLPSGAYGMVYGGGKAIFATDSITLLDGSMLLASEGIVSVSIDDIEITTLDGAIHLTKGSNTLTVAALTAPVFVSQGRRHMVVPVGMQWSLSGRLSGLHDGFALWMQSRTPQRMPRAFHHRALKDLSMVPIPDIALPELRRTLSSAAFFLKNALLPVPNAEAQHQQHRAALGLVRDATSSEDVERLRSVLRDPLVQESIATPYGSDSLVRLFADISQGNTALRMLIVQTLNKQEPLWMLTAFHPAYRSIAWSLFADGISSESLLARVFVMPLSMLSPEVFSSFTIERFAVELQGITETIDDKDAFIEHFVTAALPVVDALDVQGYPKRSIHLQRILLDLIGDTASLQDAREALERRAMVDVTSVPVHRDVSEELPRSTITNKESSVSGQVVLHAAQVEQKAYDMLLRAGALFTVDSAIAVVAPNTARIEHILFSTPHADRSVAFSVNVVTGDVTDIFVDGESNFPYTPKFEGFIKWLKK